ncbi:MAG: heavy metal translocating P-type ATPase [Planctomycetes bacterium]|nr:heavy metal translocating P-type ATPase [Planctomycetota bacterium]
MADGVLKIEVPVNGIHCASCVETLNYASGTIKGVVKSSTNFATRTIFLEVTGDFRLSDLNNKIKGHGYKLATNIIVLKVKELDTPENASRTQDLLLGNKGVLSVSHNIGIRTLIIEYVESVVLQNEIVRLLKSSGLSLETIENEVSVKSQTGIRLVISIICSLLTMVSSLILSDDFLAAVVISAALMSYFYCAFEIHKSAFRSLLHLSLNMNTLVSAAASGGFILSFYQLFKYPEHVTHNLHYFDSYTMLIAIILIGRYIEERLRTKVLTQEQEIFKNLSRQVKVQRNSVYTDLQINEVKQGDVIFIESGSFIPVDGLIQEGTVVVDESGLTGESVPAQKGVNDRLYVGTTIVSGNATYVATTDLSGSFLYQIQKLSNLAKGSRPRVQQLVDKISAVFVPFVFIISALTFIYWRFIGTSDPIIYSLNVLLISCPCALGLATPAAISFIVSGLFKRGVLIKDIDSLQRILASDVFVFDKTGTITSNEISLSAVNLYNNFDENDVLRMVSSIESGVSHPVAELFRKISSEKRLTMDIASNVSIEPGQGVSGSVDGNDICVGTVRFIKSRFPELGIPEEQFSVVAVINGKLAAAFEVADKLRGDAKEALNWLKDSGKVVLILSGDKELSTKRVCSGLAVEYKAELMPHQKVQEIWDLRQNNKTVTYVGDGINDIAAMKGADLAISFKGATSQAIENCDIVIVKGGLNKIKEIYEHAIKLKSKIAENISWAFLYNIVMIPVAAGVIPGTQNLLDPMLSALFMSASSIIVVVNSFR